MRTTKMKRCTQNRYCQGLPRHNILATIIEKCGFQNSNRYITQFYRIFAGTLHILTPFQRTLGSDIGGETTDILAKISRIVSQSLQQITLITLQPLPSTSLARHSSFIPPLSTIQDEVRKAINKII
jgi:hypothetical protein